MSLIPLSLRDLLSKLEFIGMTERGKKLCMNEMCFVDSQSWFGAYKRSKAGEGRRNMVFQINTIVDDAIRSMSEYEGTEFFPLIVTALARAKVGISNLISTYHACADTVSRLQVCLMNIQLQLDKHKNLLAGRYAPPTSTPISIGVPPPSMDTSYGISPINDDH